MTIADLLAAARLLPDGASLTLPREALLELEQVVTSKAIGDQAAQVESSASPWQEKLWTVPADTRMSLTNVCDALTRPKSWGYRHTSPASGLPRIPHRKLDGELVFIAGEVRAWVRDHEEVVVKPTSITPIARARRAAEA